MKRPIIKNAQGGSESRVERGNCVMVTSALPSEGKTFVALNLAMSIASEVDSTGAPDRRRRRQSEPHEENASCRRHEVFSTC
jgi:Mrp family chromosome partitioning ATPase